MRRTPRCSELEYKLLELSLKLLIPDLSLHLLALSYVYLGVNKELLHIIDRIFNTS